MAIDSSTGPVPSETALPTKARTEASPVGSLVRLLARQAAREFVASELGVCGAAPDEATSELNPTAVGLSAEK